MINIKEHIKNRLLAKLNERVGPPGGGSGGIFNLDSPWDSDDYPIMPTRPTPIGVPLPEPSGPIPNQPIGSPLPRSPIPPNSPISLPVDREGDDPVWNPPDWSDPNNPDTFWWWDNKNKSWRFLFRIPGTGSLPDSYGVRDSRGITTWPVRTGDYYWNPETGQFELYMDPDGSVPIRWWWRWIHGMPAMGE